MKKMSKAFALVLALALAAAPAPVRAAEPAEAVVRTAETRSADPVRDFVSRLYTEVLGRKADGGGLDAWTRVLKSGQEQGAKVAQGFVDSNEMKARGLSDDQYIRVMYRAFLNREADAGGLKAWKKELSEGLSRMHVFRGFVESPEFTQLCQNYQIVRGYADLREPRDQNAGVTKFIFRCYREFLGRPADTGGLNAWAAQLLTGQNNAKEVAKGFAMSAEFQNKGYSNRTYVEKMYKGLFGRGADGAGLQSWLDILEAGNSRLSVFYGFADSDEFRNLARRFTLSGDWPGTPVHYKMSKQDFINTLMANRYVWELPSSEKMPGSGIYWPGYRIVDLDLDGEPELLVSYSGGSMKNAPCHVYAVNKNGLVEYKEKYATIEDQLFWPEIGNIKLYYDTADNRYVYVEKYLSRAWPDYFMGYNRMDTVYE